MARMGDEGKAVGCVPPTALLSEQAVQSIQDQQDQIRSQHNGLSPQKVLRLRVPRSHGALP
jgi:hypothetical protein